MGGWSVSLRWTLVGVAVAAAGMGAIAAEHPMATSAAFTAYWLAMFAALTGALVARGTRRAACVGAFVFGFGYWSVGFERPAERSGGGWISGLQGYALWASPNRAVEPASGGERLLTAAAIDGIESVRRPRLRPGDRVAAQWTNGQYYTAVIQVIDGDGYLVAWDDGSAPLTVPRAGIRPLSDQLRAAAHAVIGLLMASVGLAVGRVLGGRPQPVEGGTSPSTAGAVRIEVERSTATGTTSPLSSTRKSGTDSGP